VSATPDVSIIIITRDARDALLDSLASIERHAGGLAVETIVVDNASRDDTLAAVASAHPSAIVVPLTRNEGGSSRNHGLRIARGRLLMFLDSDARLTAGALPDLVGFLDAHPDVGLVGPKLVHEDGRSQHAARRMPPLVLPALRRPPLKRWFEHGRVVRRHLMLDVPEDRTREAEYVIGACQLFTREAQQRVGELDPRIPFAPEDIDWCVRIRLAGLRVAYRPEVSVVHGYRRTTAGSPVSRAALQHLYGFYYFHWKWRRARSWLAADAARMERAGWALDGVAPAG
jgi:GT2 family glycosyltransferase